MAAASDEMLESEMVKLKAEQLVATMVVALEC
jgi:hypothetical protein